MIRISRMCVLENGFSFKAFTSRLDTGESVHTLDFSTTFIWYIITYSNFFQKSESKTGAGSLY